MQASKVEKAAKSPVQLMPRGHNNDQHAKMSLRVQ